jgi:hypothetical protein
MKVVINACYGGFGLSHQAVMRYAEIKGIELYGYVNAKKKDGSTDFDRYVAIEKGDKRDHWCVHYRTKQLVSPNDREGMNEDRCYWSYRDMERHDEALVKVVEELGEKAGGQCSKLKVVEIPDGVDYIVDEYDGFEHIAERHRTWG